MRPRYTGQRVPRVNDGPIVQGRARFVADIDRPGMLHGAIVRSQVAHGRLTTFDASAVDDQLTVLGPDELDHLGPVPVLWRLAEQWQTSTPVVNRTIRYVGQPLAVVVAPSRAEADDAIEQISVEIDELPVIVDARAALEPGAPLLYPERGSNEMARFISGSETEAIDAVFADADRVLRASVTTPRLSGAPMECRGIVVEPGGDGMTVWSSNQAPHSIRDFIAEVFDLPLGRIRVMAPAVGGGFGLKDHIYEDELMVVAAAMALDRPVKWIEQRRESMLATTHARDEHFDIEVAYDDDGRLRGLRVEAIRNTGAHLAIFGGGPLFTMTGVVPGPYTWEAVQTTGRLVATNMTPSGAYRGFGQTQAALVRERTVDLVAAELGRDPADLRRQNMITSDQLPYTTETFLTYDSGDYPAALERAREIADRWTSPEDGRSRGIGYASYVQLSGIGNSDANEFIGLGIGGFESAAVTMHPDGTVDVATGVSPHGQGLETTIPQLVADELGVAIESVRLVASDTDRTPYSAYGTAASRSIALGGGSAITASRRIADRLRALAADELEAAAADIVLGEGAATVAGTSVSVPISALAKRAWQGFRMPGEASPGLIETETYDPPGGSFSYATHACRVAVDIETGAVEIERYAVVHDCGVIVNPTIVEGQIHGGIAQGLGSAVLEAIVHDEMGQPLTSTFADYLVPDATNMPPIEIEHFEIPSPFIPGGMKGMGEGGTNGAMACVHNAICAALPDVAADLDRLPTTPQAIWEALQGHSAGG